MTKPTLFIWAGGARWGSLADASGWLAAHTRCLRASSSATPGRVWGARAPADVHSGIGQLWWDGSVQQIVRIMQHLSSIYQEISGRAPQALSALVICFSPPADILCKYAKQKLPIVQQGLNPFSRGVSAIRSSAHHRLELVRDGKLPLQTSPVPAAVGLL